MINSRVLRKERLFDFWYGFLSAAIMLRFNIHFNILMKLLLACIFFGIGKHALSQPKARGWEIMKCKCLLCVCMRVFVTFLHQSLYLFEDIFTKFAENVYGCEIMSEKCCTHFKQHGHDSPSFENR